MKDRLITRAAIITSAVDGAAPPHLLLTEGEDERMRAAAATIATRGFARVTVLFKDTVQPIAGAQSIAVASSPLAGEFAKTLVDLRKAKGLSLSQAQELIKNPLCFGALYLKSGRCDGAVSGAVNTSADVIRNGVQILGTRPGVGTVSSTFLMLLADGRAVTYADCGVVPYPIPPQLADIAIESARTHQKLTGEIPRVALLSFSTLGSAQHERVDLVREALAVIKGRCPDLQVDGELQFDAAFVPQVAKRKAPGSPVAGQANVFIFPNLDAGNIAYKITERVGGAIALGPLLQGLAKPWMDLSRGCNAEDIVLVAAVAAVLGEG